MARPTGRRFAAYLLTAALGMLGPTACGGSPPPASSPTAATAGPPSLPMTRQVPESLREEFALFRSRPEGLPIGVLQVLGASPIYGANPRLAQGLPQAPWPAWLIPGRGYVCLMQQETPRSGIGQTCTPTREVLKRGVSITTLSADSASQAQGLSAEPSKAARRVVLGVVPDGVQVVRVRTPRSDVAWSTVSQNVFTLRDKAPDPPDFIALLR